MCWKHVSTIWGEEENNDNLATAITIYLFYQVHQPRSQEFAPVCTNNNQSPLRRACGNIKATGVESWLIVLSGDHQVLSSLWFFVFPYANWRIFTWSFKYPFESWNSLILRQTVILPSLRYLQSLMCLKLWVRMRWLQSLGPSAKSQCLVFWIYVTWLLVIRHWGLTKPWLQVWSLDKPMQFPGRKTLPMASNWSPQPNNHFVILYKEQWQGCINPKSSLLMSNSAKVWQYWWKKMRIDMPYISQAQAWLNSLFSKRL